MRYIPLPVAALLMLYASVEGKPAKPPELLAGDPYISTASSDRSGGANSFFSAAQADTYFLAEFSFDEAGGPETQGWYGVDLTRQIGTFFHVDTFSVIGGERSLWCGVRPDDDPPFCTYAALPGYGNNWNQFFESRVFRTSGEVHVAFDVRYDSEMSFDFSYADYSTDGGGTWLNIAAFDGIGVNTIAYSAGDVDSIACRFRFQSDDAWSDEDGLWDTEGAVVIDNISITDSHGMIDYQDFETEAVGATVTADGDWVARPERGYGDFAGLFSGIAVYQEEVCGRNGSYLWGFFSNSRDTYACGGHAEQAAIPYENERGQFIANEIWSPWIEWNPSGSIPADASAAVFEYWIYNGSFVSNNFIYPTWGVRSLVDGCPGLWQTRDFIYYGPRLLSQWKLEPIADFIEPGATHVQLALGVVDMCPYWCGKYGNGECHSHAPLFDSAKLYRIARTGPAFSVRGMDLFQDNFPTDGTLSGTVRVDAALDRMPYWSPDIYPGDSLVFNCSEMSYGLGLASDGRAAVYCYVRSTGGEPHAAWEAPEAGHWTAKRFPYAGTGPTTGGFYMFQCDTSYQDAAMTNPTPDKFCFDLNDAFFAPPDRIDFYFAATNVNGHTVYWSEFTGPTLTQADAEREPMEMQCLPTGESDRLYVDDFDGHGAQVYFDTAFELMCTDPDRYDVRGSWSGVGNGLGARAKIQQILNVYHVIIWNCGDLTEGTIGDGSGNPDKSPDAQLLYEFLDQTTKWNPGLYISGDNVAEEMKSLNTPPLQSLFAYMNYNVISGDHVSVGEGINPLVIGSTAGLYAAGYMFQHPGPPAYGDTMVVYGGCPLINDFDVLEATGNSIEAMYYAGGGLGKGAVLFQATASAQARVAQVVLSGFSFHAIRDDNLTFPFDRLDHLIHIVRHLDSVPCGPITGAEAPLVNSLAQNYPNPFNPATTIQFSIKEATHVSLRIYDVAGRLVRVLVDTKLAPAEVRPAVWDGLDSRGEEVASGVYFYRLATKDFEQTRKMVVLK